MIESLLLQDILVAAGMGLLGAVVFAGVLDGFDGRIARLLRAQSKLGAELD